MAALVAGLVVFTGRPSPTAEAQRGRGYRDMPPPADQLVFPSNRFTFCRIQYTSYGGGRFGAYDRWAIDYPESDQHFSWRLSELTTVDVPKDRYGNYETAVIRLTDKELYNYPFIYMLEVGYLVFSEEEVKNLRNYLLRGGFLMVDDFWGEDEWTNWHTEWSRVFDPVEYEIVEFDLDHPIFNMVFQLNEKPQVPAPQHWLNYGRSWERTDAKEAHYRGVYDKNGRLMVVMCHNTDLGDGWEREGMHPEYFEEMSKKKAYPMGINIVIYALTH